MGPVVESLSSVPEADVRAIADYIASKMTDGTGGTEPAPATTLTDNATAAAQSFSKGATIFAGACAGCHGQGAPMMSQGRPSLGLASNLRDNDPTSAIQAVLSGIEPPIADRGAKMPAFADSLIDAQVAAVLAYARARYTDRPAWPKLEKTVREARKESTQP
jgi:mono/diheme cytochrome c family protein